MYFAVGIILCTSQALRSALHSDWRVDWFASPSRSLAIAVGTYLAFLHGLVVSRGTRRTRVVPHSTGDVQPNRNVFADTRLQFDQYSNVGSTVVLRYCSVIVENAQIIKEERRKKCEESAMIPFSIVVSFQWRPWICAVLVVRRRCCGRVLFPQVRDIINMRVKPSHFVFYL